jgi:hypothetical protein
MSRTQVAVQPDDLRPPSRLDHDTNNIPIKITRSVNSNLNDAFKYMFPPNPSRVGVQPPGKTGGRKKKTHRKNKRKRLTRKYKK